MVVTFSCICLKKKPSLIIFEIAMMVVLTSFTYANFPVSDEVREAFANIGSSGSSLTYSVFVAVVSAWRTRVRLYACVVLSPVSPLANASESVAGWFADFVIGAIVVFLRTRI